MEMAPKLRDGELLWEEVLENDVERSTGDAEEVASHGLVVGDDGTALLPNFFLALRWTMPYGMVKSLRRLEGIVAARCAWVLVGVRWGSGSKSSGACRVLRAAVKFCCGQKTRSCCSS